MLIEFSCGVIVDINDVKAMRAIMLAILYGSVTHTAEERAWVKACLHGLNYRSRPRNLVKNKT